MIEFNKSFSEEKDKENNDIVALFCGGVLEVNQMLGECYRFDEIGTPSYVMKCPPFGVVNRDNMRFNSDYNWIIFVLRICNEKANTTKLKGIYKEILESLGSNQVMSIHNTFDLIMKFIELYNKKIKEEIKNCPFCNSVSIVEEMFIEENNQNIFRVTCEDGHSYSRWSNDVEDAISLWNTRVK